VKIFAIDPGSAQSAFVRWDSTAQQLFDCGKIPNGEMRALISDMPFPQDWLLAIEKIALYQTVNNDVHDTLIHYGRFIQCWHSPEQVLLVPRSTVKSRVTGQSKASDSAVRAALIDRFGAKGTKANPNPITYRMKADIWQAFALAVSVGDASEFDSSFECWSQFQIRSAA